MKQYSLFTDKPAEFIELVNSLRNEPFYKNADDRLLLVASQEPGGPGLHDRVDMLSHALEDMKIVGLTMTDFPLSHEQMTRMTTGAIYTLLIFERSRVDLYAYDCRSMTTEEAGRRFRREIRYQENVAGILVFSAGVVKEIDQFLTAVAKSNRHDVPIIGAEAGSDDVPFFSAALAAMIAVSWRWYSAGPVSICITITTWAGSPSARICASPPRTETTASPP